MQTTPVSLLERLRGPADPTAWARFVDLYTPLLYDWARRVGLQESDAADLVQEVLVLLLQKMPQFTYDRQLSFRGWLRTVTLNKWRELHRRRPAVILEDGTALAEVPGPDELAGFEEAEYRRHLVRQLLRAVRDEFPASTWKAFEQYVLAGRPAEEVAAELHLRPGTVYAAKSRVLRRLRRELDGLLD
ncbi:MAG: sigma-70 family RNA polymerase sigma factor [Planctomycetes bacterium]|nr:sigma-70 family RNA polymerase sigma factor [Planctomycetota bacterium]